LQIPGVPIMYITQHRYSIERLPEATLGGGKRHFQCIVVALLLDPLQAIQHSRNFNQLDLSNLHKGSVSAMCHV
jgi:hypothetical protein